MKTQSSWREVGHCIGEIRLFGKVDWWIASKISGQSIDRSNNFYDITVDGFGYLSAPPLMLKGKVRPFSSLTDSHTAQSGDV